jgi:hypothetical protein
VVVVAVGMEGRTVTEVDLINKLDAFRRENEKLRSELMNVRSHAEQWQQQNQRMREALEHVNQAGSVPPSPSFATQRARDLHPDTLNSVRIPGLVCAPAVMIGVRIYRAQVFVTCGDLVDRTIMEWIACVLAARVSSTPINAITIEVVS